MGLLPETTARAVPPGLLLPGWPRIAARGRVPAAYSTGLTTLSLSKMPLKQFILQKKMERAKAELSDTDHSVAQIGYNLGYSDPHNFSAAFRKVTGLTPSGYRESCSRQQVNQA